MCATLLATAMATPVLAQEPPPTPPPDADVRAILAARVDQARQGTAMVVGIVDPRGRRIIAHGTPRRGDARAADGDTVFEIGSVTKVFTALALADAVERGEVSLDDPVATLLPGVRVPERGRAITLRDLASHTSGLPRVPSNMTPQNPDDPYADYTVDQLHAFLASYQLPRGVGAQYEYSNLGGGLLGHALARRAGRVAVHGERHAHVPRGRHGRVVAFGRGLRQAHGVAPAHRGGQPGDCARLAHRYGQRPRRGVAQRRNGRVPKLRGLRSRRARGCRGPVEQRGDGGRGRHRPPPLDARAPLLPPDSPLLAPPQVRTVSQVDPAAFDRYVGRYQLAPQVIVTISRKDGRFFAQLTGQPELEIYPETPTRFFLKVMDAQLSFQVDASGRASAVVLHQFGRDIEARRIP